MQRRSLRGRVPERKLRVPSPSPPPPTPPTPPPPQLEETVEVLPEPEVAQTDTEPEVEPTPPAKRRPGRPRKSESKPVETKPPKLADQSKVGEENNGQVILNARGMPVRQRKRNRYYEDDDDSKSDEPILKIKSEKKIKLEPVQILLDNSGNSLQVTPIMSEVLDGDSEITIPSTTPLLKKSVVKIVVPPKKPEIIAHKSSATPKPESKALLPKSSIPKVNSTKPGGLVRSESFKTEGGRKMELAKVDIYRRSDYSSFVRFFANVKTKVILPDRWGINGVMFDPVRKMKTFTMCELEITAKGDPEVRKCIQVFEDLSLLVSVKGEDLTNTIGLTRLQSEHDVPSVLAKISALKVCSGVKAFRPQDLNFHPTAQKKGACYFAAECQIILALHSAGALCPPCNKLRNAVRRRRTKVKQDQEKTAAKPIVQKVPSVFGRALYGLLELMSSENEKSKRGGNLKGLRDGLPLSEIKQEAGTSGTGGRRRCGPSIKPPRKVRGDPKPPRKRKTSGVIGTQPLTISHVIDPATGLRQTVLPHGFTEYLTLGGESGNIIIQNGGEFNFDDGQEYELIGEADPVEPMQLIDPQEEQTIQIIEVDEQTMAHFTSQNINMNGMFFSDPSNIQVTEIDPNDPNTIFKVIHPGEIYLQDRKL